MTDRFTPTDARALEDAAELCAARPDLRPTRHVVIYPAIPVWEIVVMGLIAVMIGVILATGGRL